jgi:predicted CoA-substrate-specific enzyme activase
VGFYLGIDIGSGFSKAVIFDGEAIKAWAVIPSGGDYRNTAQKVADLAMCRAGLVFHDISRRAATGYGAAMVDIADHTVTDISCHGAGIHHLFPSVRTVIDIGAQYSKAIRIDEQGGVTNFVMNEKCAGGSGKFLQVISRILHIGMETMGDLSLKSTKPVEFTTGCAVFAESEAVSRIAEGTLPEDIIAGVHKAIASKISNLVTRAGLLEECAITGGGAKNPGLVKAIETELDIQIMVPEEPRITAALGAAIIASRLIIGQ